MKPFSATTCHFGCVLAALAFAPHLCSATSREPVFSSDPETIDTCIDWFNNADASTSCEDVRDLFGISPDLFHKWNPSVSVDCEPWLYPLSYCVSTSDRPPPPGVTTTATTAASTTSTTSSSSHVPSPTAWEARGCYPDDDPDYPVMETKMSDEGGDPSLDIASCENLCWMASVSGTVLYAGVKQGNQCWCSSFIGGESARDPTKCDMPCSGDKSEICGGEEHINVFEPVTTAIPVSDSESTAPVSSTTTIAPSQSDSGAMRRRFIF